MSPPSCVSGRRDASNSTEVGGGGNGLHPSARAGDEPQPCFCFAILRSAFFTSFGGSPNHFGFSPATTSIA